MIHHLSIDIETFSSVPIGDAGAQRYTASDDFEILLFAYSVDGQPVQVIDLACGEKIPSQIISALTDPDYIKHAYNASFEFGCLSKIFGPMIPSQWRCTMVHGLYCGYTAGLDATGRALGLPEDKQKLSTGKALIKYFCTPCKPTKSNGGRTRNYPRHDPEKWQLFKEYNGQDVVAEMEIEHRLSEFPVPDEVQRQWETDLAINMRGVAVDMDFVHGALDIGEGYKAGLMEEAARLTGLSNPNSVPQLLGWLNQRLGPDEELDNLRKDTVSRVLDDGDLLPEVRRALQIRQELGKTSTKKYDAIEACVCPDGRVRGLLQFYGANRTGRFAGRLVQVQNLPRTYTEPIELARELVKDHDADALQVVYGSVSDTLSQLIRTAFVSSPGHVLVDADFSAIEARVISWLAGEQWRLDAFVSGRDIYCETASQMFGVPVEKHGPNGHLRQKGKVAELACIAKGQRVLTDKGLIPIERVTTDMRLWDGADWVSHGGVVCKGIKRVITYDGLTATEDHIVWAEIDGQYRQVRFGDAASSGSRLIKSGAGRKAVRLAEDRFTGETVHERMVKLHGPDRVHGLRSKVLDVSCKSDTRKVEGLSKLYTEEICSEVAGSKVYGGETAMHESEGCRVQKLRREGDPIRVSECFGGMPVHDRDMRASGQIDGDRQNRRERELCSWESPVGYASAELSESTPVYDILNAGSRNRFTVSDVLVHNCGYNGGPGALIAMGALDMGLTEEELPDIVRRWRTANSRISGLWYTIEDKVLRLLNGEGTQRISIKEWDPDRARENEEVMGALPGTFTSWFNNGSELVFRREHSRTMERSCMTIQLPSGRKLFYVDPQVGQNRWGKPSITYWGVNQTTKKWEPTETYGGKLTENIVQAIARDCLCYAIENLEAAGFPIVFHVHDECVIDIKPYADNEQMLEDVCSIMKRRPPWAQGLPLDAAGWVGDFFTKD